VRHVAGNIKLEITFGNSEPLKIQVQDGQPLELLLENNSDATVSYEVLLKKLEGYLTYTILKLELDGKTAYLGRSTKPGKILEKALPPRQSMALRLSVLSPRTVEDSAEISIEVNAKPVVVPSVPITTFKEVEIEN